MPLNLSTNLAGRCILWCLFSCVSYLSL